MEKKELEIPQSWDEVTVEKFQLLQNIEIDREGQVNYMVEVISILSGADRSYIEGVNLENLNVLTAEMEFLQTPLTTERVEIITIDGEKYKWKGDFNKLTVGEMVTIEQIIDLEDLNYSLAFDVICAVLLRRVKEDGSLEEFDGDEFVKNREKFSKLPITDVNGMIVFFSLGVSNSTQSLVVTSKEKKTMKECLWKIWKWKKK